MYQRNSELMQSLQNGQVEEKGASFEAEAEPQQDVAQLVPAAAREMGVANPRCGLFGPVAFEHALFALEGAQPPIISGKCGPIVVGAIRLAEQNRLLRQARLHRRGSVR